MIEAVGTAEPVLDRINRITELGITGFIVIYALFAPHSIAITQISYMSALLLWIVQVVATRKLRLHKTPVDKALLGFFGCCIISSVLSYAPLTSIEGLRSPSLFLAFYVITNKVGSMRFARALIFALIGSCLINVFYSGVQVAKGRGIQIDTISSESPFREINLETGDIILRANRQRVSSIDDISRAIDSGSDQLLVTYQRKETIYETSLSGETTVALKGAGVEPLGMITSTGRNFRITGFYNHYETYAEVLQMIAALAIGVFIAHKPKSSVTGVFLSFSILAIIAALIMTSTRASMVGLATAIVVMSITSFRLRTTLLVCMLIAVIIPVAVFTVERSRGISFFDPNEGSTSYRLVVWREALNIIKQHPVVGIGKGSDGLLRERFGLFGNGTLPPGHFHSTPMQIATWWGLPALACYAALMTIFLVHGLRLIRRARSANNARLWGIALGTTGALIAFNVSSIVHWNFGDGEVAMVLWLLAGLAVTAGRVSVEQHPAREARLEHPGEPEASPPTVDAAFSAKAGLAKRTNTD